MPQSKKLHKALKDAPRCEIGGEEKTSQRVMSLSFQKILHETKFSKFQQTHATAYYGVVSDNYDILRIIQGATHYKDGTIKWGWLMHHAPFSTKLIHELQQRHLINIDTTKCMDYFNFTFHFQNNDYPRSEKIILEGAEAAKVLMGKHDPPYSYSGCMDNYDYVVGGQGMYCCFPTRFDGLNPQIIRSIEGTLNKLHTIVPSKYVTNGLIGRQFARIKREIESTTQQTSLSFANK